MTIHYRTKGTCSSVMQIEVEDGVVRDIRIDDGCDGNLQGICRLVTGMRAEEVISRLEGISCGGKQTSCPDQLARALREALA